MCELGSQSASSTHHDYGVPVVLISAAAEAEHCSMAY
jgi:hypothetical protein